MFCRSTNFTTQFDGREVKATLAPLTLEALLSIQGAQGAADGVRRIAEALPAVTTLTAPPLDADGQPVGIAEICSNAYFANLIGEMGAALLKAAKPDPSEPAPASAG